MTICKEGTISGIFITHCLLDSYKCQFFSAFLAFQKDGGLLR